MYSLFSLSIQVYPLSVLIDGKSAFDQADSILAWLPFIKHNHTSYFFFWLFEWVVNNYYMGSLFRYLSQHL